MGDLGRSTARHLKRAVHLFGNTSPITRGFMTSDSGHSDMHPLLNSPLGIDFYSVFEQFPKLDKTPPSGLILQMIVSTGLH